MVQSPNPTLSLCTHGLPMRSVFYTVKWFLRSVLDFLSWPTKCKILTLWLFVVEVPHPLL